MKNKELIIFIILFLSFVALINLTFSQDFDAFSTEGIELVVGELKTIKASSPTRVNIVDPEIVGINKVEGDEIFVFAKKPGTTTLAIWDKTGEYSLSINVLAEDFENLRNRLKQIFGNFKINNLALKDNREEGRVVISGEIASEEKEKLEELLAPFAEKIINLIKPVDETALVQIDVQVLELTESGAKELGITWMSALQVREEPYSATTATTGVATTLNRINTFSNIFRIVEWSRDALNAKLNLLVSEGKAKVLSRPKLVCMSGKEAEFLVGGQIPIATTSTTTGGTVQTNVQFKPYGVNLKIKPIVKDDRIDTTLNTEVSDVDYGNAVTVSGARIPAFSSRTASTQLYLKDGQTVFIAGLIKHSDSNNISGIPWLSSVPLLGSLFRSRSLSTRDTELVISLTPTIIRTEEKPIATQKTTLTEVPHISKAMPEVTEETIPSAPTVGSAYIAEAAPTSEKISDPLLSYAYSVQEKITNNIVYPEEAMKAKEEGTVKLNLVILFDGSLMEASIKESSGIKVFDKNAVDTAKKLAPYPAFPSEIKAQQISIEIPISYNLTTY